jgi:peptide deformylase
VALRKIVQEGDSALRAKTKLVTAFDARLWALLDDMKETMDKADGVGLAAPQVGILRRVAIAFFNDELLELVNPVMLSCEGEIVDVEGCLSVNSDKNCSVARPERVVVEACDRFGNKTTLEKSGWMARIICHELDHLDGILFTDKRITNNE